MYKLLIVTRTTKGVASSIAEYDTQDQADIAVKALIEHANEVMTALSRGLEITILRMYQV
jgi:hypothetical protein